MNLEEVLKKVGLNSKVLREFSLKKLLTVDAAQHGTVLGEVQEYLRDVAKLPDDLNYDIVNSLFQELYALVPESIRTRNIMARLTGDVPKNLQNIAADFIDSFKTLANALHRKPLTKLEEFSGFGLELTDTKLLELKDNLDRNFDKLLGDIKELQSFDDTKLDEIWEDFNPFKTNPEVNSLKDYLDNLNKKVVPYSDDFIVPGADDIKYGPGAANISDPAFVYQPGTNHNLGKEIEAIIDSNLAAKAADVLESSKEVGEALLKSAKEFSNKALKVAGKGVGALDPGDVVIVKSLPKIAAALGIGAISSPALTIYAVYEGALLLADALNGIDNAVKSLDDNESIKDFGADFWQGFTEDSFSDKYSLSYNLTKEVHNQLFNDVHGTMTETPKTPVGAGGGSRVRVL